MSAALMCAAGCLMCEIERLEAAPRKRINWTRAAGIAWSAAAVMVGLALLLMLTVIP